MKKLSIIALIPARAGSERIINKNIRTLGSYPLLAYTISAARDSGIFDAIVVSTDREEYADIARKFGAEVPFLRPSELATSTSPDIDWIEFTLKTLLADNRYYDCFSVLRPTSPFRKASAIQQAWQHFLAESQEIDSLRAVEKCTQHPGKMWMIKDMRMKPILQGEVNGQPLHSSQYKVLPDIYVQNASLEIAWTKIVFETRSIAGSVVKPFLTQGLDGFDINTEDDWILAESFLARGERLPEVLMHEPVK